LRAVSARGRLQAGKVLRAQMAAARQQPAGRLPSAPQLVAVPRQAPQAQERSATPVPQQPKQQQEQRQE
jgi:hypothetical protein